MNDEDYLARVLAALQDPASPEVDHHDGFGREIRVTDLAVVPGEHGDELVATFELEIPAGPQWRGLDPRGTVSLPFDAEWRTLSGYADPGRYAGWAASRIEVAAGTRVQAHLDGTAPNTPAGPPGTAWDDLLAGLGDHGEVREIGPGRIELRSVPEEQPEVVTIVVTPAQWAQVFADHVGNDLAMYLDELLGPAQEDETFVVHHAGDLHRSTREDLPPVRGRAIERHLEQLRAEGKLGPGAGWYAHPPESIDDQG